MAYITTATTTQVEKDRIFQLHVTVNAALTGTISLYDNASGTTANLFAIITNPGVGASFDYFNLKFGCVAVTSAICDVTISPPSRV